MAIAHINGTELFYECVGDGPPLLLIHGLGSSGDDWAFQREQFAARHRLLLVDLRGSGRSAKPPGPYSIAGFADDLWCLLERLGIVRTDVLGFSLGGSVALEMALAQPARVRRLVLCNALADYRIDTVRKWLEAYLQLTLVRAIGMRHTGRLIARRMFPRPEQAPMRARLVSVLGANPLAAYVATVRAIIGWSALERLPALACETLILAAEHDYTPLAQRRAEAQQMRAAEIVVVPGSRHGTPFDATERFNALTLDFFARPEGDAADSARADAAADASPGDVGTVEVEETSGVVRLHPREHA